MSFLSVLGIVAWILGAWLFISLALCVLCGVSGYRLKLRRQPTSPLTAPPTQVAVRKDVILAMVMPSSSPKTARTPRMITLA